jgi:phosphoribosylformylglycinamidine cyclo-ligase
VAGTDGVGTKLKIAFDMDKHHTIGIDLVAMCVNDILTTGARPLFFLDYFATSKIIPKRAERVLAGIVEGCHESECALLGGETAEMPGFYKEGEYDLAGFAVGIVDKDKVIDGSKIEPSMSLVGIASSGFHSNGYSLIRKVIEDSKVSLHEVIEGDLLGKHLLAPTRIYVREVLKLIDEYKIYGMAHITGGGLVENIPRMFPKGIGAVLDKASWKVPPIATWLKEVGSIEESEMYKTFNMGIGYVLVMDEESAKTVCSNHPDFSLIGYTKAGDGIDIQ